MQRTRLWPILFLTIGSPAAAQAPAVQGNEVTVRARDPKALHQLLSQMAPSRLGRQVARWDQRICVKVLGLEPLHATFVKQRVEHTAKAVDLPVAGSPRCEANVVIVFTLDADALAAELVRTYPELIGELARGGVSRRTIAPYLEPHPVRWFGQDVPEAEELPRATRIGGTSRQVIKVIYTIVDANRLQGLGWGQLADFLAFISIARPEFNRSYHDPGTILSLFTARDEGIAAPQGLTDLDRSFLRNLYRSDRTLPPERQRQEIQLRVKSELEHTSAKQ